MHRLTRFALFLVFVASLNVWAAEDTIRRNFSVAAGGTIVLDADVGRINITTGGRDVSVEIVRKADDDVLKKNVVTFDQAGNQITIRSRYDQISNFHWGNDLRIQYNLHIPSQFNVDLKTAGGSIEVGDLNGNVLARTSGGHIKLGQINGPVHADTSGGSVTVGGSTAALDVKTSGGSINIGDASGTVNARTSGGSIEVRRAAGSATLRTSGGHITVDEALGAIDANTSGGSINATFAKQPGGDCKLVTSGGSINVRVAPDVRFDIDAHASGGGVNSEVPVTVTGSIDKNHLAGKLNGGRPKLEARTSGGSVSLRKM